MPDRSYLTLPEVTEAAQRRIGRIIAATCEFRLFAANRTDDAEYCPNEVEPDSDYCPLHRCGGDCE